MALSVLASWLEWTAYCRSAGRLPIDGSQPTPGREGCAWFLRNDDRHRCCELALGRPVTLLSGGSGFCCSCVTCTNGGAWVVVPRENHLRLTSPRKLDCLECELSQDPGEEDCHEGHTMSRSSTIRQTLTGKRHRNQPQKVLETSHPNTTHTPPVTTCSYL